MSSNPFNAPLALKIKPSLQKWLIVLVPHLLVLVVVLKLDVFNLAVRLLLVSLILISGCYYLRLHLQQSLNRSVSSIYQDSAKNWFIKTPKAEKLAVTPSTSSFLSRVLILMNFRDENNKNYTVIITPDSLSRAQFRRLYVRIKSSLTQSY